MVKRFGEKSGLISISQSLCTDAFLKMLTI